MLLYFLKQIYFFLYRAGHVGLIAVTFLVSLPLVQVIVVFSGSFLFVALSAAALSAGESNSYDCLAFRSATALSVSVGVPKAVLILEYQSQVPLVTCQRIWVPAAISALVDG